MPARTASSRKRRVSSSGVTASHACIWYRSIVSTPRRRSESSSARARWRREVPTSLFPSPIGKRPFVATTSWSASVGCAASQRPTISSETPDV
ncbi:hypothetical protein VV38_12020 [Clavibacter nebraskensis]|nr:hypothetical protein VV38_12020 [Clavibacter nebraskensis]OAH18500.1 hypothetical protein A3Q38_11770 [Clavibacter nebraskensis]